MSNFKENQSAILHIDGDAFFASCEIAQDERLRGKPVVAGADRGIALAVSYEAKKYGISRGMLIGEIKKLCPHVVVTLSHYDVYSIYAKRMYAIVRRYAPIVEEYSIDECFGDLSPLQMKRGAEDTRRGVVIAAQNIKRDLEQDLGMTFSIGVAPTKVLAKVASKWNKPAGFTVLTKDNIPLFLEKIPVGKIWGIGPSGSAYLMKHNIRTALELSLRPEWWIKEHLSKPYQEIWHELRGTSILRVNPEPRDMQKSIMKTGTFKPVTKDPQVLLAHLSKNTERACRRLRRHLLVTQDVYFYLKTSKFTYRNAEIHLEFATSNPIDIMKEITKVFPKIYSPHYDYRATGVVFRSIKPEYAVQSDLFGNTTTADDKNSLFKTVDFLSKKFGKSAVFLARSLRAHTKSRSTSVSPKPLPHPDFLRLGIPYWGEAR